MQRLGASHKVLEEYKSLQADDLRLSEDVTNANRVGQRNDQAAWFWYQGQPNAKDNEWMNECK
jgi:hypothetical protein